MDKVTRFGVSLEPDLLKELDGLVKERGYANRSEGIRDLIRTALTERRWANDDSKVIGTITLIYEHHKGTIQEKLMDIQHEHHGNISSTIHLHLSLEQCLEVLIVSGKVSEVKDLTEELSGVKGVQQIKLTMTAGSISENECEHHHS